MWDPVTVIFFKPNLPKRGRISDTDLQEAFWQEGLKPADPYSLMAAIEVDALVGTHFHATHWQNENGEWCFLIFDVLTGERCVHVRAGSSDDWYNEDVWLVGLPR
ncbi:MAG: hypothetical protein AAB534_02330 [Patescibacteria group bacterium]